MITNPIPLLCDNTSVLNMAKNPAHHKRSKHIDVKHHFLRDNVEKGNIRIKFYKTKDHISDIFSKQLSKDVFEKDYLKLELMRVSN